MIRRRGQKWHFQFVKAGKVYSGVCEGCSTKREAEAYEMRMRARQAAFAEQKSVDRLMERRRQEITGRDGIALAGAFDEALKKPRRRIPSDAVIAEKRSIWGDFCAFMAAKHPEVVDLAAVTPAMAEEYIALIRAEGRFQKVVTYRRGKKTITRATTGAPSSRTATLFQSTCAEVFQLLARDAGITGSPFSGIDKPAKSEETREAFTDDELRLIFDNLDPFTRPLFTVAITTALREGDICTLRWREIDFRAQTIRRVMNKTGRLVEIPIAPGLLVYLQEQHTITGGGEYVFPELAKMYRENRTGVSLRVKLFLGGLGIETTRTPAGRTRAVSVKDVHSCRHTFCYLAGMQGIPLAVVQSIVGHMTPQMTAHYTAHATLADKRRGIEAMPKFITAAASSRLLPAAVEPEREEARKLIDELPLTSIKEILRQYGRSDKK